MKTRLFKSGGSWAVRIPKEWVPSVREVEITREGNRIVVEEPSDQLRELAKEFARDGKISFARPEQPISPETRQL
jgi:virulence-associated protein VagC